MTGLDRDTSKSPDRTGVCCTGRCAPSQCETITGPSFSSLNKPDQERTPAYRDSSGSESPSGCLLCYFFRRLGGAIWGIPVNLTKPRRGLLRQAVEATPQARRVPFRRRTPGRHQPLPRRTQQPAKALQKDRRPRQDHRRRQTWAPSVRLHPLEQPLKPEFNTRALVVVQLRVGHAPFIRHDKLWTEPQHRYLPVQHRRMKRQDGIPA